MQTEHHVTFDRYRLDLAGEQLWCGSEEIPLPGKAFAMLRYLIEHAGQLLSKAELFAALWASTAVTDGALTFCIVELRKALGDTAKAPRFIETVHRRGYRFIAPLTATPPVSGSRFQVSGATAAMSPGHRETWNVKRETPLVGREVELVQLHIWLTKVLSGERQMVFVTGEPGIGKTTLIDAFLQSLASRVQGLASPEQEENQKAKVETQSPNLHSRISNPSLWLSRGQCIEQYGPGEPYMPILEALGRLCREPEGERLITVLRQQAPTWLVQMPTLLPAVELEALQRQTKGVTRERMLREMGEAIDVITAERPLVLWLEDLHWSDASTLELLALLARRQERARLLVIGTYRPGDVLVQEHPLRAVKQELQLHGLCRELPLGLLSEPQVAEYLIVRFPVGAQHAVLLQELAHGLHRRTDGNPLFMVTAVEDLIEQKMLVQHAGQWTVQDELATIETRVPDTLQHLIERQIERLRAEDRRMLEVASVAGMEFSAAAVAAAGETETEMMEERCEGLVQRGQFLRAQGTADWPDGTVAARYSFLHALYPEVLYTRIPAGRRRQLHQRIGEREEQAYGKRAREIAAALAVHFEQGRDYGKAVQYLQQAGENAVRRSAYQEAITHFTAALELLKTLPDTSARAQQELTLQVSLGVPLIATKGYAAPEVEKAYTRARELCQQTGETAQFFPVLGGLWQFHLVRAEYQTGRELGELVLSLAQNARDLAFLVEAHDALGQTLYFLGELGQAQAHLEQGILFYDPQHHRTLTFLCGGEDPGVACRSFAALALWLRGYPEQALKKGYAALTLAQELTHPFSLSVALGFTADLHQFRREEQAAQELANALIALSTEQGFTFYLAWGTIVRGWALAEQGQVKEGIAQIREGLAAYRATGAELLRPYYFALLTEAYSKGRQVEEGLSMLGEALAVVDKTEERFYEAELYRLKGELTLKQESPKSKGKSQKSKMTDPRSLTPDPQSEAKACFLQAIEIARKQHAKSLELRAVMSLSRLWQQQGKQKEAHELLSEIYGWFTEGFDTKDLQEAKALLEELS